MEAYELALGDPVGFSATHANGLADLFSAVSGAMVDVLRQWRAYQEAYDRRHAALLLERRREEDERQAAEQRRAEAEAAAAATTAEMAAAAAAAAVVGKRVTGRGRTGRSLFRATSESGDAAADQAVAMDAVTIDAVGAVDTDKDKNKGKDKKGKGSDEVEAQSSEQADEKQVIRVVVAGKPNVGKSTLINAILGKDRLLTGPQPGVTRDSVTVSWEDARFPNHSFELVDTAGIKGVTVAAHSKFDRVDSLAMAFSMHSIRRAHVVVLVLDIVEGLYGAQGSRGGVDPIFAEQLHRNFVEALFRPAAADTSRSRQMAERSDLGRRARLFSQATADSVARAADSAAHSAALAARKDKVPTFTDAELDQMDDLAFSTSSSSSSASSSSSFSSSSSASSLVSGKPRGARPDRSAYADRVSMIVQRVATAISKHDLDVARAAVAEGKGLVVVANKIDLLRGGEREIRAVLKGLNLLLAHALAQNKGVTVLPLAARAGTNVPALPGAIVGLFSKWSARISTGLLNRWLRALVVVRPPPNVGGRPIQLKYMTQTNSRPPTFALFCSRKTALPAEYRAFLENSLREEFGLHGSPIRLHLRSGVNPYVAAKDGSGDGPLRPSSTTTHRPKHKRGG